MVRASATRVSAAYQGGGSTSRPSSSTRLPAVVLGRLDAVAVGAHERRRREGQRRARVVRDVRPLELGAGAGGEQRRRLPVVVVGADQRELGEAEHLRAGGDQAAAARALLQQLDGAVAVAEQVQARAAQQARQRDARDRPRT